jgi:pimeloyl-ACP methyl ester carboxylesterase
MSTIALVHGAWHDGSSWDLLAPLLESGGHRVVAPDLPCDDVRAGFEEYAAVVVDALDGDLEVVLVGHSLGSDTIPLVATARPVGMLVYLCPRLGGFERPEGAIEPVNWRGPRLAHDELGRSCWSAERAMAEMYPCLPPAVARRLAAALRPQADLRGRPYPVPRAPLVPSVLVYAADDEFFPPEWCRWAARHLVGAEAIPIPGGHFPMLERPEDLAALLLALVGRGG